MLDTYRKTAHLIGAEHRRRWVLLVFIALVVSAFETVGAGLVFVLIGVVTGAEHALVLPLVGDPRDLVPGFGAQAQFAIGAAVVAGFFVARGGLFLGQAYIQHRVAENAGARLSTRLLRGYLRAPYAFHLQRNSAELIRNSYDTVQVFVKDVLLPAVRLVSDVLIVGGLLAVLLIVSPTATLLAVGALGPLVALLVLVIHPRLKALGVISQAMARQSLKSLAQSLGAWRDIRVLGREEFFEADFAQSRFRHARTRYLRNTAKEVPRVVIETVLVLFIIGFLGLTLALRGTFGGALPVLGLFAYAALRLQPTLNRIFGSLNSLRFADQAVADLHRDVETAERYAASSAPRADVKPLPFTREVRLDGVSFRYAGSDVDALDEVDLAIARGESIGIVGSSGGGKTTLLDILIGLLSPSSGRVLVDGVDIRDHSSAWHANIGMVSQSVYLVDDTVRRNIALGLSDDEIDERRVSQAVREAQLEEFIDSLPDGLGTVVGERGVRVSGGQRQRVAIARALYRRPSVLVLDEGTAALDTVTEAAFIEAQRHREGERTVVIVAHRLATVRFCDRIVLVDGGRVAAAGTFAELERGSPAFRSLLTAAPHEEARSGIPGSTPP